MRSPSARCLIQSADIYRASKSTRDAEAGYVPTYTLIASGVPCSAQLANPGTSAEHGRLEQVNGWNVFFGRDPQVAVRDKLAIRDTSGVTRTLYVLSPTDAAGRGSTWVVPCEERL